VKRLLWRLLDPLLLKMRARLEHLDRASPSTGFDAELRRFANVGSTTRLFPTARLVNASDPARLTIGEHCYVMGEISLVAPDARFRMGDFCSFGKESRVWASREVTIGNYVLIAHLVDILDNNSHSLDHRHRRADARNVFERELPLNFEHVPAAPIVIEDDVWIGAKSTILKGVTIGKGAVVAANSVVTRDVAPFTLVAGNPARVVRRLEP